MHPTAFGLALPYWVFFVTFGVICTAALYAAVKAYRRYRGSRVVTCPADHETAFVELDVAHAALTAAVAWPELRVADCTHWPARRNCGQSCLEAIEAAPNDCLVSSVAPRWYEGKSCVYCGRQFAGGGRLEPVPAVIEADGRRVPWHELPPEQARAALAAHPYVCWDCRAIERARRQSEFSPRA